MTEPCLKWIGGKRQLVPELLKHVNAAMNGAWDANYFEPFAGGAALFFALRSENPGAVLVPHLNDANPHLVNVYTQIRDNPEIVISVLAHLDSRLLRSGLPATYALVRDQFNAGTASKTGMAAAFIAMNAWGFNGLCRFNKKGGFNVPCGKFAKTPVLLDKASNLRAVSEALQGVEITCGSFEAAVRDAEEGDLVYFDPPYIPASATSDFTSYTSDGFNAADQEVLRDLAIKLSARGVHVILSNSDTPAARQLYQIDGLEPHFLLHEVQARRAVNCRADRRGSVGELIIVGIQE